MKQKLNISNIKVFFTIDQELNLRKPSIVDYRIHDFFHLTLLINFHL